MTDFGAHNTSHNEPESNLLENFIRRIEFFGINVARLILGFVISIASILFIGTLVILVGLGIYYRQTANPNKYEIVSVDYQPNFTNILVDGKPQLAAKSSLVVAINAARSVGIADVVARRIAIQDKLGICPTDETGSCTNLELRTQQLTALIQNGRISTGDVDSSSVGYISKPRYARLDGYYDRSSFADLETVTKAIWISVNNCLDAYAAANGNLYIQKEPVAYDFVANQCAADASQAVAAELSNRPADWTVADTMELYALLSALGASGFMVIMIALTIIVIRIEVNFRALQHLEHLKRLPHNEGSPT